jgi:protein disulfide-isomerase A6
LKGNRPPTFLTEVNPLSIQDFQADHNCTMIVFYRLTCPRSVRALPEVRRAAPAFEFEPQTRLAIFNCGQYADYCKAREIEVFPNIRVFRGLDPSIAYPGSHTAQAMVDFVNEKCGIERGLDAMLSDTAGLLDTDEVEQIVREFGEGGDRAARIAQMQEIAGAHAYVEAMRAIVAGGQEALEKEIAQMAAVLAERKGAIEELDAVKRRMNAFREFRPRKEPPAVEAGDDEEEDSDL